MGVVRLPRRAVLVAGSAWAVVACSPRGSSQDVVPSSPASAEVSQGAAGSEPAPVNLSSAPPVQELDHSSPSSLTVLVNKRHPLEPLMWAPDDLVSFGGQLLRAEVAQAAEELFAAASAAGFSLLAVSGYRSYEKQAQTYQGWVAAQGQEMADTASARPGFSEHQTGLALDIGTGGACDLQVCFSQLPEATWLAEHCSDFGFVLRFPWTHHETTGYWYESWHFRYIGREQATKFRDSGTATLEEFWGFDAAPDYG